MSWPNQQWARMTRTVLLIKTRFYYLCGPGWTGADCTVNIDECVNHTCQNGASCQDEVNNYTCRCLPKFTGKKLRKTIYKAALA